MTAFARRSLDVSTPTGKGQVAFLDFGDPARPVDIVFSHANGFNALTYRHILEPLADDMRIIAFDLRGHGRTNLPTDTAPHRSDWTDLRDDLLAVLTALKLDRPVVLAGHSFGGTSSLMATHLAPEKVKSLILYDPVLYPNPPGHRIESSPFLDAARRRRSVFASRQAAVDNWRGRGAFTNWPEEMLIDYAADGLVETADGVRLACDPAWETSSYVAQGQNGVDLLLTTPRPTLAFRAEIMSTCTVKTDDPSIAANPNLKMVEIEGTTHFLPMERPDLVRQSLRDAVL